MKHLLLAAVLFAAPFISKAQSFNNYSNCEINLYSVCYDPVNCLPYSPAGHTNPIATIPGNTASTYSSGCNPGDYVSYYIEYTPCPNQFSAEITNMIPWCGTFSNPAYLSSSLTGCPGCDDLDVSINQVTSDMQLGNPHPRP